jgi:hypothetical protein
MKDNPFARHENWRHWVVAVLAAAVIGTFLIVVLTKLGGQSNRPDVERAMKPPPREAPASTANPDGSPAAPDERAPQPDGASGAIRR